MRELEDAKGLGSGHTPPPMALGQGIFSLAGAR